MSMAIGAGNKVGAELVEVLDVPAAFLMKIGLGSPTSRFVTLSIISAGVTYLLKVPQGSFRKDGSSKPLNLISHEPDAVSIHKHFLFTPVVASFAVVAFLT